MNAQNEEYGFGRLCTLEKKISIEEAVQLVKIRTGLNHVRLARARQTGTKLNYSFKFSSFKRLLIS